MPRRDARGRALRITEQYWIASIEAAEQAAAAPSPQVQAEFLRLARSWADLAQAREVALDLTPAWRRSTTRKPSGP